MNLQKTYSAKRQDIVKKWYLVDAKDQVLGRLSVKIAPILKGKHKPMFTPHMDCGDFVVVINAEKIKLTGEKWTQKRYYRHSGHVGGLKSASARETLLKHPTKLVTMAVRGMLPKTKLGDQLVKKLKVYAGEKHPHAAQKVEPLKF